MLISGEKSGHFKNGERCIAAEPPNRKDAKAAKGSTAQGRPSAAQVNAKRWTLRGMGS